MIAEFMNQSESTINALKEDDLKALSLKIKEHFEIDETITDTSPKGVYDLLWASDPIATEGGIFDFCVKHNLYSQENKEYRDFLKRLDGLKFSNSDLIRINESKYNVDEAIRNNVVSIFDIKEPTEYNKECLLQQSFITLCSINNASPKLVSIGLDKLFVTYCDEKAEYMSLTRQIDMIFRRLIEHGFDSDNFKYEFKNVTHKEYFFENVKSDANYYNFFDKN